MQQQTSTTNQPIMPQPPTIVSTKDHLYLTDMLSWNLLAMKKANHWASETVDSEIKTTLQKVAKMHEQHYKKLLTHLEQPAKGVQGNPNTQIPLQQ